MPEKSNEKYERKAFQVHGDPSRFGPAMAKVYKREREERMRSFEDENLEK